MVVCIFMTPIFAVLCADAAVQRGGGGGADTAHVDVTVLCEEVLPQQIESDANRAE